DYYCAIWHSSAVVF
nr:immunoglobulin light chain junction region [Macaca mulatta]MOW16157.1 immunoglobulin light chain junction region [Macaca mulatta]